MNVLVDRHHSGLYRSLQLLGDRLGWTVYTPAGLDWWDEWYWSFGRSTYLDDRLARQFLTLSGPDDEFPGVPINYVTLPKARTMDWAYVVASVPDNEAGFRKFADEMVATYVLQVGNTGQAIDWSRQPLALVSSEMPIVGRGVVYHQEMEPVEYVAPYARQRAASFVNCMPSMGTCWDVLQAAQERLPIGVFGIDGWAGVVKPYRALLAEMARVGWGWHDKAQGDGFGHVIHSWAAVGRPLVGHASHYRGRMAERFWQDGVTCIDLDRHSVEEAVERILTIGADEHEQMCRAIRAEFDAIDYAAEAESIAALLGIETAVAA